MELHFKVRMEKLKKLAELDDTIAKTVFKDEIKKRFSSGKENIIEFLINGGYLSTKADGKPVHNQPNTNIKVIVTPKRNTKVKTNTNYTRPNKNKVKTNRSNTRPKVNQRKPK